MGGKEPVVLVRGAEVAGREEEEDRRPVWGTSNCRGARTRQMLQMSPGFLLG